MNHMKKTIYGYKIVFSIVFLFMIKLSRQHFQYLYLTCYQKLKLILI